MTAYTFAAAGEPGHRMVVAPTPKGQYIALPRPYAKNSLATLKQRSSDDIRRMPFPYSSVHTTMSCCRWTHPFGNPVLPDEYSQKAGSSLLVGSASSSADASAINASNTGASAGAGPCGP